MRPNSRRSTRWRDQTDVRKAEFGFAVLLGDLKDDVRAVPLGLVFDKVKLASDDMPDDFLARNEFRDLLRAAVNVLVAIRKLGAEFVGAAVDLS